ncbi:carboxymuconolactone decarboxylase family protein [Virgibacillus soli]|uniref:Carboxymuconolactone decarboxylase family protein n=1 Tax=Paracerasibacillus soli TaxID=480284 RepID=A0ABU5CTN9_9BACI|nr:carboxymuconolactone decarboxylase family protein [Virgibacillus soli]MDY0409740.1 carboxymuconolactone decarboxylase family protein [Virgibacillus soli]
MEARIDYYKVAPQAAKIMMDFEKYIKSTNLESTLLELVKTRASQINGCAFCLDMHTKDARANGETEQRLYALNAWRETDFYTEKERAALALTEAVTQISTNHISDELYREVRKHFAEKDFVDLVYAINTINSWNRLAITTRAVAGVYQPRN